MQHVIRCTRNAGAAPNEIKSAKRIELAAKRAFYAAHPGRSRQADEDAREQDETGTI